MKASVAEILGKKAKGIKHCTKLLGVINERGSAEVQVGNTGLVFTVAKGDYIHTYIQSIKSRLEHEINAIEIAYKQNTGSIIRAVPAPRGAAIHTGECKECGKVFTKQHSRQLYCCSDCKTMHNARKKAK